MTGCIPALCHNEQTAALLLNFGFGHYFSTLPSSSISAPCILLTLTQLKRVQKMRKIHALNEHDLSHYRYLVSCLRLFLETLRRAEQVTQR